MIHTKRLTLKPMEDYDQADMLKILTDNQIKKTYMLDSIHS